MWAAFFVSLLLNNPSTWHMVLKADEKWGRFCGHKRKQIVLADVTVLVQGFLPVGILILEDDAGELKSRWKLGKEGRKRNVAEEIESSQGQKWNYCVFDRHWYINREGMRKRESVWNPVGANNARKDKRTRKQVEDGSGCWLFLPPDIHTYFLRWECPGFVLEKPSLFKV